MPTTLLLASNSRIFRPSYGSEFSKRFFQVLIRFFLCVNLVYFFLAKVGSLFKNSTCVKFMTGKVSNKNVFPLAKNLLLQRQHGILPLE